MCISITRENSFPIPVSLSAQKILSSNKRDISHCLLAAYETGVAFASYGFTQFRIVYWTDGDDEIRSSRLSGVFMEIPDVHFDQDATRTHDATDTCMMLLLPICSWNESAEEILEWNNRFSNPPACTNCLSEDSYWQYAWVRSLMYQVKQILLSLIQLQLIGTQYHTQLRWVHY